MSLYQKIKFHATYIHSFIWPILDTAASEYVSTEILSPIN